MGEVFLAIAQGLGQRCVIKTILPEYVNEETLINRFVDEAKIMVTIDHDNVVRCFDCGRVEGMYYIAMEYVHGRTLADLMDRAYMRRNYVPLDVGLYVTRKVLGALDYIHNAVDNQGRPLSLVHRDLSPDNVLIGFDGTVKITDFGLARTELLPSRTEGRVPLGKWGYMAPEQALHSAIDGRTDVYAVGSVLFELFTGQRLIDDNEENMPALWERVLNPVHPPPTSVRSDLPREFDDFLLKAVAQAPDDRYAGAHDMLDAMERLPEASGTRDDLVGCVREMFADAAFEPPPIPSLEHLVFDKDKSVVFALSEVTASHIFSQENLPSVWSMPDGDDDDSEEKTVLAPRPDDPALQPLGIGNQPTVLETLREADPQPVIFPPPPSRTQPSPKPIMPPKPVMGTPERPPPPPAASVVEPAVQRPRPSAPATSVDAALAALEAQSIVSEPPPGPKVPSSPPPTPIASVPPPVSAPPAPVASSPPARPQIPDRRPIGPAIFIAIALAVVVAIALVAVLLAPAGS